MRTLAFLLLAILLPLATVVALFVILLDGKPILFFQKRVGLERKPFILCKFRSMDKGRVTTLGKLLRKSGLDEIPQLWNILRGEMSLVGPRPLLIADIERMGWAGPENHWRWSVLPGITCLAQLSPLHSASNSLSLDRLYVQNPSVAMKFWILIKTLRVPFFGKRPDSPKTVQNLQDSRLAEE